MLLVDDYCCLVDSCRCWLDYWWCLLIITGHFFDASLLGHASHIFEARGSWHQIRPGQRSGWTANVALTCYHQLGVQVSRGPWNPWPRSSWNRFFMASTGCPCDSGLKVLNSKPQRAVLVHDSQSTQYFTVVVKTCCLQQRPTFLLTPFLVNYSLFYKSWNPFPLIQSHILWLKCFFGFLQRSSSVVLSGYASIPQAAPVVFSVSLFAKTHII